MQSQSDDSLLLLLFPGDLPQHLQVMINILRSEDRIKLAVRLESSWSERVRYMVVVYTSGRQDTEENILLGVDFTSKDCQSCSIGMVLPLWSDTNIHLDGDGGFTVSTAGHTHVFKPVSVQAMWSALQVLHKVCEVSRRYNYFPGGTALTWTTFYQSCISSEQSCINQWNIMTDLESSRADCSPPPTYLDRPSERERTESLIRAKLRSIMTCRDLDNVTCKQIRTELEQHMKCQLKDYKEFIDNEMLLILGQMDKATLIFDHVYLGSEWNASNLEELQETGVRYILNVTREIDNFFPGTFSYHNVRVYDNDATDLLAHWNDTYNFIVQAKRNNSKCLVHCKMGVSRSASTVIAYAMKEFGWSLEEALTFVKQRRSITRPNQGFMRQLAEYQGILDASKQRHNKLWQPDADCEMAEGSAGASAQCCTGEEGGHLTPELRPEEVSLDVDPGVSLDMDPATPCRPGVSLDVDPGVSLDVDPATPCRPGVSLDVDPAYNHYYFRRLSDSALDSEPSTPSRRGPPVEGLERIFIQVEDVERDALLDDQDQDQDQDLPLHHGGAQPLEELRLRLEFSTVEEVEEQEEEQKDEAEMEVLMQPDGGGGKGGGDGEESEGNGMDLATLNENCNNNKRLVSSQNHQVCPSFTAVTSDPSVTSHQASESRERENPPPGPSSHLPDSCPSQRPGASFPKSCTSCQGPWEPSELVPHPCGPQQEGLLQLQRSGLVRRRAQQMETLAGLTGPTRLEHSNSLAKVASQDLHSQALHSQDLHSQDLHSQELPPPNLACCSSSSSSDPPLLLLLRSLSPEEELSSPEVGAPPSEPRS
ncbi:protein phosphatase Slingshot homolog 1 isoform X2 [Nelusetta ayraudi]|uniref:protein phosphatase Slingshot homolog 1 isoform X2 n=1 Tax=Nelusetta ayraudi TaxID=303726 RepID=UPI003F708687